MGSTGTGKRHLIKKKKEETKYFRDETVNKNQIVLSKSSEVMRLRLPIRSKEIVAGARGDLPGSLIHATDFGGIRIGVLKDGSSVFLLISVLQRVIFSRST